MELRLYSFVNQYLSGIHAGIQTGHAAVDLLRKYKSSSDYKNLTKMVEDWADNHKTFIILNGGSYKNIKSILNIASTSGFPFAQFNESKEALNGIITCVAVILPETIFNVTETSDQQLLEPLSRLIKTSRFAT